MRVILGFLPMLFASHNAIDLEQRLGGLPREGLPLKATVNVHWEDHHIPFIEAENDADLAVALGIVHVHLRWGQMEIMRRVALGRVSEMIGPFGVKIDHVFRALGLARVAASIAEVLPAETAQWLESFVTGINHAIECAPRRPSEFRTLGISRERWRVEDVLALGRLAAVDVTWLTLIPLLREHDKALAARLWRRAVGLEGARGGTPTGGTGSLIASVLTRWLCWTGGSNSVALAPSRSASGGAWLASDPHLPVMLPNPFLIAGYKSPSFHVVGLMIPGLPFVASGRNPKIAWGGTNLHAASSDLFDVSDLPRQSIAERRERIRVRWGVDRTVTVRESPLGPVVSDLAILGRPRRRAFALRWVGSMPSDEITAMLRLNRATNWDEFRASLGSFAVPGQNLTYADAEGHIGKVMAVRLPRRPFAPVDEPVRPGSDADQWRSFLTAADLPVVFDPGDGFVASANEKPSGTTVPIGYVFSSSNRSERLSHLLGAQPRHSFHDLTGLQQDVIEPSALKLRDDLVQTLRGIAGPANGPVQQMVRVLAAWDGRYNSEFEGRALLRVVGVLPDPIAHRTQASKPLCRDLERPGFDPCGHRGGGPRRSRHGGAKSCGCRGTEAREIPHMGRDASPATVASDRPFPDHRAVVLLWRLAFGRGERDGAEDGARAHGAPPLCEPRRFGAAHLGPIRSRCELFRAAWRSGRLVPQHHHARPGTAVADGTIHKGAA